jgi:hypothetical protein
LHKRNILELSLGMDVKVAGVSFQALRRCVRGGFIKLRIKLLLISALVDLPIWVQMSPWQKALLLTSVLAGLGSQP